MEIFVVPITPILYFSVRGAVVAVAEVLETRTLLAKLLVVTGLSALMAEQGLVLLLELMLEVGAAAEWVPLDQMAVQALAVMVELA
jgi:hypothetical protein